MGKVKKWLNPINRWRFYRGTFNKGFDAFFGTFGNTLEVIPVAGPILLSAYNVNKSLYPVYEKLGVDLNNESLNIPVYDSNDFDND